MINEWGGIAMIGILLVCCVLYVFVMGLCIVADFLSWNDFDRIIRKENRLKKGLSDDGQPVYHWFRNEVLRRGLPSKIALLWGGVAVVALSLSPESGGVVGVALFFAFVFYVILNCFFDVDGWLLDQEIDWDYKN